MARQPRQQRIDVYGGFTPTGVDRTAGDKMRALAGLGQTMEEATLAIGKPMVVAERVKQAEIASAETGTIDPETGELRGPAEEVAAGKFGAAQANAVMRNTYESNVAVEINNIVDSAAAEFPDDIVGYQNKVTAGKKGLIGAMPEEYKGKAENLFARLDNPTSRNIAEAQKQKAMDASNTNIRQAADVAEKGLSNAAFAGDVASTADFATEYALSLQRLVDQGDMTTDRQAELLTAQDERIIVQGKLGEVDRAIRAEGRTPEQQIEDGRAIVEALRENPDADLSAEKNQELINKLEANVNSLEREYLSEASTLTSEENKIKADFKIQVGLGLASDAELTDKAYKLFDDGVLTADELATNVIKINKASQEQLDKAQGKARVSNVYGSDQPSAVAGADQTPIDQKDVDVYYNEEVMNKLPTDNPDARSMLQADFVAKTRFIPADMAQELTNDLRSEDPERIQNAAETIDRIVKIPGATDKISKQDRAFAAQVSFLAQFKGADIATQEAMKQTDPDNALRIESRTKTIKDNPDDFADSYSEEMVDIYGEGFFEKFNVNDIAKYDLVNDYGRLVESYYKGGMDLSNAKAQAQLDIETNYKQGEFGFMKFRPEDYYAVGGSAEYIREDLYNTLTGPTGIFGLQVAKEDIILVSDDETARTASTGKPSYRVMYRDSNGTLNYAVFDGVDKNGAYVQLDRYEPDVPSKEEQAKIIKAQIDKENQLAADRRSDYVSIRGTTFGARN
jgi:hypothetical protein